MMIENADLKSMFPMIAAGASTFLDEKYLWDVPQLHLLVIFNRAHVGYYSHRVLDMSCYFVSLVSSLSLKQLGQHLCKQFHLSLVLFGRKVRVPAPADSNGLLESPFGSK